MYRFLKKYKKYIVALGLFFAFCVSVCFIPIDATRFIPVIEKQVLKEYGVNIHIEKLIFRFGPSLKIKAPNMHVMYEDGQKFAQFNNVKFFVPWSTLFKEDVVVKGVYADKLIVKISSKDKFLEPLLIRFKDKDSDSNPNVIFKEYSISYTDYDADNRANEYSLTGSKLELTKLLNHKNMRIDAIGEFLINENKYISYDLAISPEFDINFDDIEKDFNLKHFIEQIKSLDFHSDIIADIKIYKNDNAEYQASGLFNIDNISVLDPQKKEPKSFIYLTFLGNKTRILSNIYASADKKIYIDGIINNSKKPELDLKVKTDNIKLTDLYKKIKLIADCSKFKGIEIVNGNINADFSIRGDLNKIKSSGYFRIENCAVKSGSLNINRVNSEIDFSNNTVNISNASGFIENAPVMLKGKIDKNLSLELLMSKVELKHLFKDDIGVKSGLMSVVANIEGTLENPIHKENIQIDNFNIQKDNNSITFSKLKFDTNKDNTAYINNLIAYPEKTEFIKIPLLKLYIDKDVVKMPETNIFMPNSKLTAKAEAVGLNAKNPTFNINVEGFVNSRDIKDLNKVSSVYPIRFNLGGNKETQNVEMQIILEKSLILDEPSIINFVSKIENDTLKIDDLSVSSFSGNFTKNVRANLKGPKKIIVTGNLENIKNEPIFKNIRIFIPQSIGITLEDTISQLKGDIFVNGKLSQPEIVGQINLQNVINQYLQFSANNMTIDFNKNIAQLSAPSVKLSDSSMGITSSISTDFSKGLHLKSLNVKSKYVNLDTLLMYKDAPFIKSILPVINDGKFYTEKAYLTVYGSPLQMSALSSDFKLENNIFYAKNIASELFNGKLAGNINFNLRDENFKAKLQARGVSAAPIFDVALPNKGSVSGSMDFDINLDGNISSKQALDGDIKFVVHNGRMGTLGKLEHLLYAQNVVADNMLRTSLSVVTRAITLKDTGLFKYLRGDITMSKGIANINMLQSQGPLMSLYIKGQYSPVTDYAKLVVLGRLSDEIISGLGTFGDFSMNKLMIMLTGEDNKYNLKIEDLEKLPQLSARNTKEFRSVINGILEKPSSVILFNWISYSQKSYRQKDVPLGNERVPEFVETLPY